MIKLNNIINCCPICGGKYKCFTDSSNKAYLPLMMCDAYPPSLLSSDWHKLYFTISPNSLIYFLTFTIRINKELVRIDIFNNLSNIYRYINTKLIGSYDNFIDPDFPDLINFKNKIKTILSFS